MRTLFDTSIIIAALVEPHPMHGRSLLWFKRAKAGELELVVAGHTLAEVYAVLSSLPLKPRISPSTAWRLIHENIEPVAKIVSLTPSEYISTVKGISRLGLSGGIIYDALIVKVAQKSTIECLVTLNVEHFNRVWPEGRTIICAP
jgi:predicted nucleic acid-binding protein